MMTDAPVAGKWLRSLFGDTPCVVAARRVLRRRLRMIDRMTPLADGPDGDPEHVHQLRVAARRAEAGLAVFEAYCDRRRYRRLRRYLRRLRRAAAALRQNDVHREAFESDLRDSEHPRVLESALEYLRGARPQALEHLAVVADQHRNVAQRKRMRRLLPKDVPKQPDACRKSRSTAGDDPPYTLAALAALELPEIIEAVRDKQTEDLRDPVNLHELRIAGKRLRYALEIFAGCFPLPLKNEVYPAIVRMLDRLGEINDLGELADCIDRLPRPGRNQPKAGEEEVVTALEDDPGFAAVVRRYRDRHERCYDEFLTWWASAEAFTLFDGLAEFVRRHGRQPAALRAGGRREARGTSGTAPSPDDATTLIASPASGGLHAHRRVAAIDIGTNSIRLVVGEANPLSHFRVIEELKESTRLGSGVFRDRRMTPESMEASVRALERMKSMAEGCHVDRIRAVATSAVREAANRGEFVAMVERRTGIRVEVIDAEREARLAFSSVANSFELDDRRVAVVDIGGGSTELVLSSGGVIDAICPLPLGAVRLTETFNGRNDGKDVFDEMRRAIHCVIEDRLGAFSYQPYLIMGTGGTFTSLARVAIRHGASGVGAGRFPFAVRGYELRHSEVLFFLDLLRRMPIEERRKTPGLSTQRAEIIVAGVSILERLMAYFGVERVRVHDGGIRDGLLVETIDELGVAAPPSHRPVRGSLDAVRRFAERSRYDRAHSQHVAFLALRIFDQLAEHYADALGTWGRLEARHLLHAAALLHDVGIAISYRGHHKHSYDMVLHADLPGYTRRDIEVIANICRYHRRGGPKERHVNYQRLGDDDQRLVLHLVAILRVADGLDRLRLQDVTDVIVSPGPKSTLFDIIAAEEPAANLRHARRKADVLEDAFETRARFAWVPTETVAPEETAPAGG